MMITEPTRIEGMKTGQRGYCSIDSVYTHEPFVTLTGLNKTPYFLNPHDLCYPKRSEEAQLQVELWVEGYRVAPPADPDLVRRVQPKAHGGKICPICNKDTWLKAQANYGECPAG